jgi:hypothetical protein
MYCFAMSAEDDVGPYALEGLGENLNLWLANVFPSRACDSVEVGVLDSIGIEE